MNSFFILSNLLRAQWLIEPSFAEQQGPIISNILNRYTEFKREEADFKPFFSISSDSSTNPTFYSPEKGWNNSKPNSVAVIHLTGPLLKQDQFCGPVGMNTIGTMLKKADKSPLISSVVLVIDSPGGTVDGTETLANIVKTFTKPIVTFVDGMMCSAAIWIGSGTNHVMASTQFDSIGSVGVMISFADVQPFYEKMGIKFHAISASSSPDKLSQWEKLRAGDYEEYISDVLDPLHSRFKDAVKSNRPGVKDELVTGKVYFAKDVIGSFIDSIGTLDHAVKLAFDLASELTTKNHLSTNSLHMKYPKIASSLNLNNEDFILEADGGRTFTEDELQAMETAILADLSAELRTSLADSQSLLDTANTTIAENQTTISDQAALIATLQSEVTNLKGSAADNPAVIRTDAQISADAAEAKPISDGFEDPMDAIEAVSKEYLNR